MIKCLLFICVGLIYSTKCQKLSPCPSVFNYDQNNYQGRWDGQIRLQTDEELSGVFVTVVLDHPTEKLVNWFGEPITRNNKEFTIRNNDYILVPGINVTLKFYVEYNDAEVPSVTTIRLNGRTICSETKKVKPIPSPAPFTSIKITPRTTTARFIVPTSSPQIYRPPVQTQLSDATEYDYDIPNRDISNTGSASSEYTTNQNKAIPLPIGVQPLTNNNNNDQDYDISAYVTSVHTSRPVSTDKFTSRNEQKERTPGDGNAEVQLTRSNGDQVFEKNHNTARQPARTRLPSAIEYDVDTPNRAISHTETGRSEYITHQNKSIPVSSGAQPLANAKSSGQEYDQILYVSRLETDRAVSTDRFTSRNEQKERTSGDGNAEVKSTNRIGDQVLEKSYSTPRQPTRTQLPAATEFGYDTSNRGTSNAETGSSQYINHQNKSSPPSSGAQTLRNTKQNAQEYNQNVYVSSAETSRNENKDRLTSRNEYKERKSGNGNAEVRLTNRNGDQVLEKNYNTARQSSSSSTTRRTTSKTTTTTEYNIDREVQALGFVPSQSRYKCGKPSHISASPLILYGQNSTEGEWPWHVALYKNLKGALKYICGGSLISNYYVITAAHCVTAPDTGDSLSPNNFVVYVGTASIKNFSPGVQIVQIAQINVHPEYNQGNFHNDIAILKTIKPIEYNNNVLSVCLWDDDDDLNEVVGVLGTVVGWGLDENSRISEILKRTEMPIVNTVNCIYSKPDFFSRFTSLTSFCAGFRNGSNACNGDSGSGMVIGKHDASGSVTWYLRGLVSTSVPIKGKAVCDPYNYIIFTDVAKFTSWIRRITKDDDYNY